MKTIRFWIQALFTALTNGYLKGFSTGVIYQGNMKHICVPTLNCYSCPAALYSCPIGAIQATIAGGGGLDPTAIHTIRERLVSIASSTPFFVIGFLFIFGAIIGRASCGWMCPFGWFQDIINKIPSPKFKGPNFFKYIKYLILIIFVLVLPAVMVDAYGGGEPTFCKFICPAGTLEAGIPLAWLNPDLRAQLGWLFSWKVILSAVFVILMVFFKRPFCRWACPLGATLSPFNKVSLFRLELDNNACIECGMCSKVCPIDLDVPREIDSLECIRCLECVKACPKSIIKVKKPIIFGKKSPHLLTDSDIKSAKIVKIE